MRHAERSTTLAQNSPSAVDIDSEAAEKKTINSKETRKKLQSYVKIFINYLQIISIINYFKMNWPYDVSIFLTNYSNISMGSGVVSVSCILFSYDIDIPTIYIETLSLLMIPVIVYIIAFALFAISYLKTKKSQTIRFISMSVALNTLLQPSMIRKFIENIACQQIDDKCYLISNMNIDYYSDFHQKWVFLNFYFNPFFYENLF